MEEINLRLATFEDLGQIWKDIQNSFSGSHSVYVPTGQPGFKLYLEDLIERGWENEKKIFVVTVKDELAGFADVTLSLDGVNFLTRIGVFPKFRGRRIASKLMHQIVELHPGANSWELDVFDDNDSARKMYEAKGFVLTSTKIWIGKEFSSEELIKSQGLNDFNYSRYGFTNIVIDGIRVAIAGSAVRCSSLEQLFDEQLRKSIKRQFPKVNRGFVIMEDSDEFEKLDSDTFLIARSCRMAGKF